VDRIGALEQKLVEQLMANGRLREDLSAALGVIVRLELDMARLEQDNADLRAQLAKNSGNSGKPPSSDGLKKPPRVTKSLRGRSGKKSGGQVGHKGASLRPVETPDKIETHEATQCTHCQGALTSAMATGVEKRQVFDIPKPRLEVTEHQAAIYCCAHCQGVTRAAFPEGITRQTQYGPRLRQTAVYYNVGQLLPEERVAQIMRDAHGAVSLCSASVVNWVNAKAESMDAVIAHILSRLTVGGVRHLDETGLRVAGKLHWLHSVSNAAFTHYRVSETRGDVPTFLEGGTIVHDHFKSYYAHMSGEDAHALCGAHHLRELKAVTEIDEEPWAEPMAALFIDLNRMKHEAMARGETALAGAALTAALADYRAIVAQGLALHEALPPLIGKPGARGRKARRDGHNLLIRLRDYEADVLRFITDFDVPFTNNEAEQVLRMMKARMKISGCFRTLAGARVFAKIRSLISTARKHGLGILHALSLPPDQLILAFSG
jgi:transposase